MAALEKNFVHLHVHTEYSLLDGMSKIKPLIKTAHGMGMPALAITDHGTMYGAVDFFRACRDLTDGELKPIIGIETYITDGDMRKRDKREKRSHILLLAKNPTGYQNLLEIASASQLEGFYYNPRIDHDFLKAHAEGLITTSGCLGGVIPGLLLDGREDAAIEKIQWYLDVFGEDFFLELQDHAGIPELPGVNRWLIDYANAHDIPLVATNDLHYINREDAKAHDVLLCVQTGNTVTESKRMKMSDDSYYLRSPDEMWEVFGDEVPEALANTLEIAKRCEPYDLESEGYHLPIFPVPEKYNDDAEAYLRALCEEGLKWRYGDRAGDPEVVERLNHELKIIHDMGFDTYFLIVWDLCNFSKEADIWWNVRGSGAGSVAAYSLGITSIDPLQNNLIFERFLNPGRQTMPDIDLDYPDDRREEMIKYTVEKYGAEKVAAIITFGTMGPKAAVRDVGRALDIPLPEVDMVARLLPNDPKPPPLMESVEEIAELKELYDNQPHLQEMIDTASQLEGLARHASTHAAGVIVADKPLIDYIPLHRSTRGSDEDSPVQTVTQFPMETCESLGLLKVDYLGLRTLTQMRKACELIEQERGVKYELETIPYRHTGNPEEDRMLDEAFDLIGSGETLGVFQVESGGMRKMLKGMRPHLFENIIAAISLYRPGPIDYIPTYIARMHGEEEIEYKHPKLEPILAETYGIIVYQEQIMQIASDLFGYSLGDADLMRRAVSKKKEKDLIKHRAIFKERGPERGVSEEAADAIFDDIAFFARYGFNKSHAADYATITVRSAFLKKHYTIEYLAALMTTEHGDTAKLGLIADDCATFGIRVLPPKLDDSMVDFSIEHCEDGASAIRFGLSAIKNVGEGAAQAIVDARGEQPFKDLSDFCDRVDLRAVGRRAIEFLIKVGAMEKFGNREQLLVALDRIMGASANVHKARDVGQLSLFGGMEGAAVASENLLNGLEDIEESDQIELREWEKELIGMAFTEHPVLGSDKNKNMRTHGVRDLDESMEGRSVTIFGMVTYVRQHTTKKGSQMAFAGMEDLDGIIELIIFPRTWEETRHLWGDGAILQVRGKVEFRGGTPQLLVDWAKSGEEAEAMVYEPSLAGDDFEMPALPDFLMVPDDETADTADIEEPPDLFPPSQFGAPAEPTPAASNGGNGHTAKTNGGNGHAKPKPKFESPIIPQPAEKVEAAPSQHDEACRFALHLRPSGDTDTDIRIWKAISGQLQSHHGDDHFQLVIERESERVIMAFPGKTTGYGPELRARLDKLIEKGADLRIVEM